MDKDEILEKSRKENWKKDLVEAEALSRASEIAVNLGVVLCALLSVLRAVLRDSIDYGVWTVMFGILAAVMLIKFARLRRRHELLMGLAYGGFGAFFFARYLCDVLGGI